MALVEAGLFESRAKAGAAIAAGGVLADGVPLTRPAAPVRQGAILVAIPAHPWVSRGGVKLAAALRHLDFDPSGLACLDIGASTGGFTQVMLEGGAGHVHAVDVGRDQFHASLRADPRVTLLEGTDARRLPGLIGSLGFDLITCDVSFISLTLVLPHVLPLAAKAGRLVALVKPQFEAGPGAGRKGVVRDPAIHEAVCRRIAGQVREAGWTVLDIVPSPIDGQEGNREFLLGARRIRD